MTRELFECRCAASELPYYENVTIVVYVSRSLVQ